MDKKRLHNKVQTTKHGETITLWFVRHGESDANTLGRSCPVEHDTPLTGTGKTEALQAAEYFKKNNVGISSIYTSPLQRSRSTAEIIAAELGLKSQVRESLRERNWGTLKVKTWQEVAGKLDTLSIQERYTMIPEEGESWQQMEERLFLELEAITSDESSGKNIVIVTHKGCLRAMLTVLHDAEIQDHKLHSVGTGNIIAYSFSSQLIKNIQITTTQSQT